MNHVDTTNARISILYCTKWQIKVDESRTQWVTNSTSHEHHESCKYREPTNLDPILQPYCIWSVTSFCANLNRSYSCLGTLGTLNTHCHIPVRATSPLISVLPGESDRYRTKQIIIILVQWIQIHLELVRCVATHRTSTLPAILCQKAPVPIQTHSESPGVTLPFPLRLEKRPMRLRLKIEIEWHSKRNRLNMKWQLLKSRFATIFTIYIDYRSDFWEISPAPSPNW